MSIFIYFYFATVKKNHKNKMNVFFVGNFILQNFFFLLLNGELKKEVAQKFGIKNKKLLFMKLPKTLNSFSFMMRQKKKFFSFLLF